MSKVIEEVKRLVSADSAALWLVHDEAPHNLWTVLEPDLKRNPGRAMHMRWGRGVEGCSIVAKRTVHVADCYKHDEHGEEGEEGGSGGGRSRRSSLSGRVRRGSSILRSAVAAPGKRSKCQRAIRRATVLPRRHKHLAQYFHSISNATY